MRFSLVALCGAAFVALSACGGVATSPVPREPADTHTRSADGSTVAYENGHLYVASDTKIRVYPAHANSDGSKALRTISLPSSVTATADIAVAPDGTIWLAGASSFFAFAPGQSTPELNVALPSPACSVALDGDGVDVMTSGSGSAVPAAVYTYPYGGGAHPKPIRTLTLPTAQWYCTMSTDYDDHIYTAQFLGQSGKDAIREYAADASGAATAVRTLYAPAPIEHVTVAANGTAYAVDGAETAQFVDVATTTATATGRRAVIECSPAEITSIAVDASGYVYAGLSIPSFYLSANYSDPRRVDEFGPSTVGSANPLCSNALQPPTNTSYSVTNAVGAGEVIRALAIGP
jgi:hypothetical protein